MNVTAIQTLVRPLFPLSSLQDEGMLLLFGPLQVPCLARHLPKPLQRQDEVHV